MSTSHTDTQPASGAPNLTSGDSEALERRNILTLVMHQVLFRAAWIFKTESVIMPAFLDSISGAGWIRGLLPALNRFGQSLAPLVLSERLSHTSLKSRWLTNTTFFMSLPFLALGGMLLWLGTETPTWFVAFFLVAYGTFFCVHGVNQASFNTIQGKLIRPTRRGRLMAVASYVGSPVAVVMAWLLLRPWTQASPPKFAWIFLFTGAAFFVAGFASRRLVETPDPSNGKLRLRAGRRFHDAWTAVQRDRHLRRLCLLAALFVCSQLLFPHYQRMGRHQHGYEGQMLMIWVVAQHLSAAVFSWGSGRMADRYGTRSALRALTFLAMFAPLLPLVLTHYLSARWYWLTFAWLGFVPVTYRMFLNYALELTHRQHHPIYVSTVVLCMAPVILLSPLIGEIVDQIGYQVPFCVISIVLLLTWCLTLTMAEPRSEDFRKESALNVTDA